MFNSRNEIFILSAPLRGEIIVARFRYNICANCSTAAARLEYYDIGGEILISFVRPRAIVLRHVLASSNSPCILIATFKLINIVRAIYINLTRTKNVVLLGKVINCILSFRQKKQKQKTKKRKERLSALGAFEEYSRISRHIF